MPKIIKNDFEQYINLLNVSIQNTHSTGSVGGLVFYKNRTFSFDGRTIVSTPAMFSFEGAISGIELMNTVAACKDEFQYKIKDNQLLLTTASGAKVGLSINTEIEDYFVELLDTYIDIYEQLDEDSLVTIPVGFGDALIMCSQYASTEFADGTLQCVSVQKDRVFGTDNRRILRYMLPDESVPDDFMMYASTARRLAETKSLDAYLLQDEYIVFTFLEEDCFCITQKVEGDYPDVGSYFERDNTVAVIGYVSDLGDTIALMDKLSHNKSAQSVEVTLTENQIELAMFTVSGWVRNKLKIDYNGEEKKYLVPFSALKQVEKYSTDISFIPPTLCIHNENFTLLIAIQERK